jgi:hypothetical protein
LFWEGWGRLNLSIGEGLATRGLGSCPMNDWEKKELFSFPAGKESVERHAPEKAPSFWDKYGEIVVYLILMIVIAATFNALGIVTPRQATPRLPLP